jgi:MFS-type transporter involved in bile tolerance (Atg22 family)
MAAPAIVAIWALASAASAFANVSFTAAMAEAVPTHRRAGVISLRYAIHAVITAATLPITGRILDTMPFPLGYQVVFLFSFVAAMLSAWVYGLVSIPDQVVAPQPAASGNALKRLQAAARSFTTEGRFTAYLIASAVFRIGLNLPAALFSIFWVNELQLADGSIAVVNMVSSVSSVIGYFYWGRMAKRRGHGPVLWASGLGLATYPVLTAAAGSLGPVLVAAAAAGWFSAGINLAFFNVLLAVAPEDRRSSFVAMDALVANSIAFIGPLLGSVLTDLMGIRQALLLSGAFRLAGGVLFLVKRVRD